MKSGYTTKTILCLPIKAKAKTVGVIQLINKNDGVFEEDDIEMMTTFLDLVGPILLESNLVANTQKAEGNEFTGNTNLSRLSAKSPSLEGFAEEEEDEEEET